MDEDRIEELIADCLDELDRHTHNFSAWEQTFLESIDEQHHERHLSDAQVTKLVQIWEDKCV